MKSKRSGIGMSFTLAVVMMFLAVVLVQAGDEQGAAVAVLFSVVALIEGFRMMAGKKWVR